MNEMNTSESATTPDDDLSRLGVAAAADAIRKGEISSEQYTTALLRRAHQHSDLNAFVLIDEDAALASARSADLQRAAGVSGPLLGVPLGVKDSYLSKGLSTSFGLQGFAFVPEHDADVVDEVKRAGGLLLGKNNLVAMSYGLTGKDSHAGQVKNPRNPSRVSGGSSSGAGAAVGAHIVPASLGGDTVGSIRVPAALSGVVGFKPTTGRWSGRGVAPISHTLDTTGVLARSVEDCALIDHVVARSQGPQARDLSLRDVRFASAPRQYLDLVAADVRERFEEVVRLLRSEGAHVVEVDLGDDFVAITRSATWAIFAHETVPSIQRFLHEQRVPITFEEIYRRLSPDLQGAWEHIALPGGPGYTPTSVYQTAVSVQRDEIQQRFSRAFQSTGAQAFLLPTTPCTAPSIDQQVTFSIDGQQVEYLALANNTVAASLAGLPGISLPAGLSAEGLPIGLELDGRYHQDEALLQVAGLVEQAISTAGLVR
ncbi:amidase family protein [Pseudomonas machongensis]